jgi:hypothetical protein
VRATRRQLIVTGGATLALGPVAAAAAAPPAAEELERLLGFERRLEEAYRRALERDAIEPGLGRLLVGHERDHVGALEQVLGRGSSRASVPSFRLGGALASRAAFARYAIALEGATVAAYERTLAVLDRDRLLQPLGSIMAAGAQHQVALRDAAGEDLLGGGR